MGHNSNATTAYICPVHASVRQSSPGKCAECGMALVPENNQFAPPRYGASSSWGPIAIVGILVTVATAVMMFMR